MKKLNTLLKRSLILSFCFFITGHSIYSQEVNPRVVEVENVMKENVSEYIRNLLPNQHFLINIKITPLRRTKDGYAPKGDILPYFEVSDEDIKDEWDDPTVSHFRLYRRIQSSQINIIFTSEFKLANEMQFSNELIKYANLVPGRDKIKIEFRPTEIVRKSGSFFDLFKNQDFKYLFYIVVFLFGLGVVARFGLKPRDHSKKDSGAENINDGPSSFASPARSPSPVMSRNVSSHMPPNVSGDVSLSDPTKTLELIRSKINEITDSGTFPNLHDMMELEKLANLYPSSFTSLVYEFPLECQRVIFQNGKGSLWYQCFSGIGQIDRRVLTSLDHMLRERKFKGHENFEKVLIQCWRIDHELHSFLAQINSEDAYSILYYLPKNISIPIGRKLFAGSWGSLVGKEKIPALTNTKVINKLLEKTYHVKPLLSYESLDAYKNSKDLLEYLKISDIKEEEEIYSVVKSSSDIAALRPPFFKFFSLEEHLQSEVFKNFSLQEWALSIFDTERYYRKMIDNHLDDKQRFLLSSFLKGYDTNPPSLQERGDMREQIGRSVFEVELVTNDGISEVADTIEIITDEVA